MANDERRVPLDARLDLVPAKPGVYLMKDASGRVIYVGKANSLRHRLANYFSGEAPRGGVKVEAMVSNVRDFDFIVCNSEFEALLLECNLIKRHQPRYNILLKDDREYPYIRVTLNETYPRVVKAFRIGEDRAEGARYYGPYLGGQLYEALEALRAIFPMKTCQRIFPRDIGKERPCLNYHIGRCIAPCLGTVSAADYRAVIEGICRFLEGRYDGILQDLQSAMETAAKEERYESAAVYRDRLNALSRILAKQKAVSGKDADKDALGFARNGTECCVRKLEIRAGRIVGQGTFFLPDDGSPDEEILAAFLVQHYPDAPAVPPEILVPCLPAGPEDVQALLAGLRGARVALRVPQRGDDAGLEAMAAENAAAALHRRAVLQGHGEEAVKAALDDLAALLGLPSAPYRVEAFDISNTANDDKAASMVVFLDGKPDRKSYRLFRIGTEGRDDRASLQEAVSRRLGRKGDDEFGAAPDLILMDGGIGQVQAAQAAMSERGWRVPVAGMVKDDRHRTRGLVLPDGRTVELGLRALDARGEAPTDPEERERRMRLLRLLTAVQDEAHRFAQKYNRKLMSKRTKRFTLEGIAGIGPTRRRALLEVFGTIKAVSEATEEQLAAVTGMTSAAVAAVQAHFHPAQPNAEPQVRQEETP